MGTERVVVGDNAQRTGSVRMKRSGEEQLLAETKRVAIDEVDKISRRMNVGNLPAGTSTNARNG